MFDVSRLGAVPAAVRRIDVVHGERREVQPADRVIIAVEVAAVRRLEPHLIEHRARVAVDRRPKVRAQVDVVRQHDVCAEDGVLRGDFTLAVGGLGMLQRDAGVLHLAREPRQLLRRADGVARLAVVGDDLRLLRRGEAGPERVVQIYPLRFAEHRVVIGVVRHGGELLQKLAVLRLPANERVEVLHRGRLQRRRAAVRRRRFIGEAVGLHQLVAVVPVDRVQPLRLAEHRVVAHVAGHGREALRRRGAVRCAPPVEGVGGPLVLRGFCRRRAAVARRRAVVEGAGLEQRRAVIPLDVVCLRGRAERRVIGRVFAHDRQVLHRRADGLVLARRPAHEGIGGLICRRLRRCRAAIARPRAVVDVRLRRERRRAVL